MSTDLIILVTITDAIFFPIGVLLIIFSPQIGTWISNVNKRVRNNFSETSLGWLFSILDFWQSKSFAIWWVRIAGIILLGMTALIQYLVFFY